MVEHALERGVEFEFLPSRRISGIDPGVGLGEYGDFVSQSVEIEKASFAGVVEVRRVVGDFIDPIDELGLERGTKIEKIFGKMGQFRGGVIVGVLDDALANFEGEIQARKIQVRALKSFDDAQGLEIVIEARAVNAHQLVEFVLAGMAEGRMADIVNERESLGELRIEAEGGGHRASDLRDFESMGEPIAKMIGVANGKDLRLGFEAAESARVDDAVAVSRVDAAVGMRRLRIAAAA